MCTIPIIDYFVLIPMKSKQCLPNARSVMDV
jgi:hypothetical protein